MKRVLLDRVLPGVDRVGFVLAVLAMGLIVVVIGSMLYEVVARRFFNAPTLWANDITYMTNGSLFLLGAAYTLRNEGHVRIDFLSNRLPVRAQHAVNFLFYFVLFLPLLALTAQASIDKAWRAWVAGTLENMSTWEPVVWPFLTGIALGVTGLALQVAAQTVRHAIGVFDPAAVPAPGRTEPGRGVTA